MQKTYRPYETLDTDALLAVPTVERITAVRALMVRTACLDRATRERVCQTMNWPVDKIAGDLGELEYIAEVARVIFTLPDGTKSPTAGLIPRVVYAALDDFFA